MPLSFRAAGYSQVRLAEVLSQLGYLPLFVAPGRHIAKCLWPFLTYGSLVTVTG